MKQNLQKPSNGEKSNQLWTSELNTTHLAGSKFRLKNKKNYFRQHQMKSNVNKTLYTSTIKY